MYHKDTFHFTLLLSLFLPRQNLTMKNIIPLLLSFVLIFNTAIAQTGKPVALETIGASASLLLYNTYVAIGAVSDAYAGECYKADIVAQLAEEQINSSETLIQQYNTLIESGFLVDPLDKQYLEEIVITFGYLKNEAIYLKALSESGSASDIEKYESNRAKAWEEISRLLGFEEGK
jgi:hypothetical protein